MNWTALYLVLEEKGMVDRVRRLPYLVKYRRMARMVMLSSGREFR